MAYDVSTLGAYVPQNTNTVLLASVFGTRFMKEALAKGNLQLGVKTSSKIILMDGPVTLQAQNGCTWLPSGSANITDKTITVAALALQEEFCAKDVQAKYLQLEMMPGSDNFDETIFKDKLIETKQKRLAEANENLLLKGDTAGSGNLVFMDGLNKQVTTGGIPSNTAPFTTGGPIATATGITVANVMAIFDGIENATPLAVSEQEDRIVICGSDTAKKYGQALRNANLFAYSLTQDGTNDFIIPGTSTRVMPVGGMNGSNMILSFAWSNVVTALDLEGEEDKIELLYDAGSRKVRVEALYKVGMTFARNSEVAYFKLV